jgi:HK97 family phage portal protein
METPAQRDERIGRLEQERAARAKPEQSGVEKQAQGTVGWPTPDLVGGGLTQIAPGRGNLNYSSTFYPAYPTALWLIGGRVASFARLFMSQPWIGAAVMRMLTWSVRVPLKMYRRMGEGDDENSRVRLRPGDHPLADALVTPWDRGYQAQLVQHLLGPVLVHGNSVTEIQEGASGKIQFMPKDWRYTVPMMPFRDSIDGWAFDSDVPALHREVSVDDVLHIAWWSPAGPIGCSPLQQLGVTLRIEDAAQRHQEAQFMNGARPPSAITASDEFLGLDRTERQEIMAQLRGDITDIYTSPENAGRPALLPPGLDWKTIGHSSVEVELIEQRKIAREEVAGVYMIPPPLLGILERATYSNIETQREMTYTDCLGPPLVLIEQVINSQIIQSLLREDDVFVEFDFAGVLRGDRLQEIQSIKDAIATALMTPNEGRDVLNYQRSLDPGMDQFYLPFNNLAPVGTPPVPGITPGLGTPGPPPPPQRVPPGRGSRRLLVKSREGDYEREYAPV